MKMKEIEKLFSGRLSSLAVGEFLNPREQLEFEKHFSGIFSFTARKKWRSLENYWHGNLNLGLRLAPDCLISQRLQFPFATNLQTVWGLLRKKVGEG